MNLDIGTLLNNWEYQPGTVQARMVEANDGRQVIQMRVDLGILQLEKLGRPDGSRPHGYPTYLDFLRNRLRKVQRADREFLMSEKQCHEADREFIQFYHRRICWLALKNYSRAMADADHTLAFMDFVRDHGGDEEYIEAHEQYRGFVLFQRTQAAAAFRLDKDDPEAAIDEIHKGLESMREFFAEYDVEEQMEEHPMVQHLRKIEQSVRNQHGIDATLREQLDQAVAEEEYEKAARIRDALREKRR